ncbi:MAG: hypothetical protein KAX49_18740 [Halanaerobiales bacterium]|nr:hypothetical protein [Halanaerobiales bacterium]
MSIISQARTLYNKKPFPNVIRINDKHNEYRNAISADTSLKILEYKVFIGLISKGECFNFDYPILKILFNDLASLFGFAIGCYRREVEKIYLENGGESI